MKTLAPLGALEKRRSSVYSGVMLVEYLVHDTDIYTARSRPCSINIGSVDEPVKCFILFYSGPPCVSSVRRTS